jgi:hypothetical protein
LKYPDLISISDDIFRRRGRNPADTHPPTNENKSIPLSGTLKIHRHLGLCCGLNCFFCRDIDIFVTWSSSVILQLTDRAHVSSKWGHHAQTDGKSAQGEAAGIVGSLSEICTEEWGQWEHRANDPLITILNHREIPTVSLFTDTQLCN